MSNTIRYDSFLVHHLARELENELRGQAVTAMQFDATVLVYAPEPVQIARQVARDGCDAGEATRRVRAQMPIEEKKALADRKPEKKE